MLDAVVIGAGAAGLGAARALADAGRSAVVLEARARIGGRVWTDHTFAGFPVECGAEFIHGNAVATWEWVRRAQAETIEAPLWAGRRVALEDGRLAGHAELDARPDLARVQALDALLEGYRGPELSMAGWLAQQGVSGLARHLADVRMIHSYCATPDLLSASLLAHELRESAHNGPGDFRIARGYDSLLDLIAAGLDIHLGEPVIEVRWGAGEVAVTTAAGEYRARAAIITLPLALLKAGAVRFAPALPERKLQAIAALPMLPAMKVIYRFAEPFWEPDAAIMTLPDPRPVWWMPRAGRPVLTNFLTGPRAAAAKAGPEPIVEAGLAHLARSFGAAPRQLFQDAMVVDWGGDEWARGGYSTAGLGCAGQRAALAEPCGALRFAGEATVTGDSPATVHGALRSGERAARELGA